MKNLIYLSLAAPLLVFAAPLVKMGMKTKLPIYFLYETPT